MGEEKRKKPKDSVTFIGIIALALILGVIAIIFWLSSNGTETNITSETNTGDYSSIECKTKVIDKEAEFLPASEGAIQYEYTITMLFNGENFDSITYAYDGEYETAKTAETQEAKLRAQYYNYLGKNGLNTEYLNPVLVNSDTKLKISFYAERKKFNSIVSPFFFIDSDTYSRVAKFTKKKLEELYREKGFSCKNHD